ncbi:MAG: phytochelatin synthase family protein [Burkholderiales bacterium]|nr:phytochelatin synthase family protein [Burkholderiales bacterium]
MSIRARWFSICLTALFIAGGSVRADSLPLAPDLISLSSQAGETLLLKSEARRPFLPLSIHFVTQKNQAYCGVASMAMVLNALNISAPTTPEYAPFRLFTQENVLDEATDRIIPQALIAKQGLTLDQLGAILSSHGVEVTVRHASDLKLEDFRREAIAYLSKPDRHVLVNYLRKQIGQERGGHISPLAAYDAEADRFLIMDVSRYKYPPVWVKSEQLFAAMNTPDADNQNRSRGFVLVSTRAKVYQQEK